ncbi:prepilin-type N-terminal cleavage/methylation domain-containing protein [Oribacterium sp. C9]|uniref:prepilin-type N-terminal cleavage/methylation domain-containing protein n=1 Tax=Oribacterium sp. C9 TaxID=1943579 RepID=UPI00143BF984|nr:prepilin-type N-terminal cleavage/methylation domain-containing protein [Oribacterium sp. C9]
MNKNGFTLAELLVVVAIMMILAGVSFVAINTYVRNFQVLEMDNTAKELFIVAQNHLSEAYASGEYERKMSKLKNDESSYEEFFGDKITDIPSYIGTLTGTEHEFRYKVYNGDSIGSSKSGVLSYMLPDFSIDQEISDNGNYIIVYDVKTASILGVFYSGQTHTFFGSAKIHTFNDSYENEKEDIEEAVNKKEKRKHYPSSDEDSVIGRYVSDGKDEIPNGTLIPLTLTVDNEAKLTANIFNPNYKEGDSSKIITLKVTGETSKNSQTIEIKSTGNSFLTSYEIVTDEEENIPLKYKEKKSRTYETIKQKVIIEDGKEIEVLTFILDDITDKEGHFCKSFPVLIPGEDIRVVATISDTSAITAPKVSNEVKGVNSLFGSYNLIDTNGVVIRNIRHLENLSTEISNLCFKESHDPNLNGLVNEASKISVTKAYQIVDLIYSGTDSFVSDTNNANTIYKYDGTDSTTGYYGISNSGLIKYDGLNNSISNVDSKKGANGNTGIFAETNLFELRDLTVENSTFEASANAGSLIGYSAGKLTIQNCTIKSTNVKAENGKAGGLVGYSTGTFNIDNSFFLNEEGNENYITSKGASAGGIIGDIAAEKSNITNCIVYSNKLNITSDNGDAGGILGNAAGAVTMESCSAAGEKFTVTGKNAGGVLGSAAGLVIMDSCSVTGKNAMVSGENAGGIMGISNGGLKITNTYCSSFVFATANAGGFIGYIEKGNSDILFCYTSGHTKDGNYGTGTAKNATAENYNVISDSIAGGFIGYNSAQTRIYGSYSTCSVYSSSSSGYAGGFVGKSTVMEVNNCYSAGPVNIAAGGTAAGFACQGVSAHGNNYFLKGKGFNATLSASASGNVDYISSTGGNEISVSGSTNDAKPWDSTLGEVYPYWTIMEIPAPTLPTELEGISRTINMHYGDWTEVEDYSLVLQIRNAEKLTAILNVPTSDISTGAGVHNYVSMCIEGESSAQTAYMQFELFPDYIVPINRNTAITNITASGGGDTSDYNDVVFPEYSFPSDMSLVRKVEDDKTKFYIDLDDITTFKKNFAAMFTNLTPGEDIRVTAEWGAISWNTLSTDADAELKLPEEMRAPITGRTNSLFKSGSGNSSYKDSYYSDIDKANNVQTPGAYGEIALISNFRHLQNLDTSVSGVGYTYKKAKICRNLYWKANDPSNTNVMPSNYTDFITAIKNGSSEEFSIYPYTATNEYDVVSDNNAFYGIVNDNIIDFDGDGHSINNILISNGGDTDNNEKYSAGLFRKLNINSDATKDIKNLYVVQPTIVSRNGYSGGLIGNVSSSGFLNITNVFIYGKESLIRAIYVKDNGNGTDAGGFIGSAVGGGYNISNCGSSSYVYAEDKAAYAGGFIGDFEPDKATNITDCFVGGHINSSQEYLADYVVSGDSNTISPEHEGGYNICGNKAVGGFFGNLETNIDSITKIEHCFTTASVYCGESKSNDGAVGGFVGRIQYKHQQYSNCYMEGKVYAGTAYAGSFIGDYKQPGPSDNNSFENVYVLMGKDFNDDTNLKNVSFSHNSCTISGITPVAHDDTHIVQEDVGQMDVKTFNRTPANERFPYKDSTMIGTNHVFYGDWVVPEKIESIEYVLNGNDLKFNLIPPDVGWQTENLDGETYYVRYIRLKGELSNAEFRWKVMFNEDRVIIKHPDWGGNTLSFTNAIAKFVTGILNGYLEITFDDIAQQGSSFYEILDGRSGNGVELIPGENISLYSSDTLEGLSNESSKYVEVNSLFERIEPNDDGPNTYTAFIGNARHLENLNPYISKLGITVTRAKQTGNIYWEDDGSYEKGKPYYTALYPPYLTENPDANIHESHGNTIAPGMMMALMCPDLKSYDGGGYTIYRLRINQNMKETFVGLFSSTIQDMTIQNLILKDPVVSESASGDPKALLVGKARENLYVNNVAVLGDINITNGQNIGGLIGECNKAVTIENINIFNSVNVSGKKYIGGIIGYAKHSVSMNNVAINENVNAVLGDNYGAAGGMIGRSEGNVTITNSLINGCSAILIYNSNAAGGLVGGTGGTPNITGTSINGGIYINSNPDNRFVGAGQ